MVFGLGESISVASKNPVFIICQFYLTVSGCVGAHLGYQASGLLTNE